jgi:PTS system nitrogen regulatory IIA component
MLEGAIEGVRAHAVLAALREREESMSTGIGLGIAVPHARLAEAGVVRAALVRYPRGIEFEALDHRPIFLAFGIVGPPPGTGHHVQLLARIARLVKGLEAFDEMMSATSPEALVAVLARRDV